MSRRLLFCLPYAGGSARVFEDWSDALGAGIEVVPLELPGRGLRFAEAPVAELEPLVAELTATVAAEVVRRGGGPLRPAGFALLGYSYGSVLAFETARRLEARHGLTAGHLLVAAMRGPRWPGPPVPVSRLSEPRFRERLRALGGTPVELLENEDFMTLMTPVLRADFEVADGYLWRDGPGVSCPVTAYGGSEDRSVSAPALSAWADATSGPFRLQVLPGDHFFLRPSRSQLLREVAEALGGCDPSYAGVPRPRPTRSRSEVQR
jgi:medium-chain acyl-[acyl-carrier-protein] hydrolase